MNDKRNYHSVKRASINPNGFQKLSVRIERLAHRASKKRDEENPVNKLPWIVEVGNYLQGRSTVTDEKGVVLSCSIESDHGKALLWDIGDERIVVLFGPQHKFYGRRPENGPGRPCG